MPAKRTASPSRKKPAKATRKRTSTAGAVEDGDIAPTLTSRGLQRHVTGRRSTETNTVKALVLGDLLKAHAQGVPPGDQLEQLRTLIAGASLDELKALRGLLFQKDDGASSRKQADIALAPGWRGGSYPYQNLLSRRSYEQQKYRLQVELLKLQAWVKETGQRVVILFEGRDAAGKGGAIKRFMEHLKLSPVDKASLDKWDDYTRAKESMFLHCDTSDAPWTVIKSDCKKRARLNAMRYVLHRLPYSKKKPVEIGPVEPLIVGRPSLVSSLSEDELAIPAES